MDSSTVRPAKKSNATSVVWFVKMTNGEPRLVSVKRNFDTKRVETSVRALLTGPSDQEMKSGYGSEIPRGTILLAVRRSEDEVEVDLSRRFSAGGGITSLEARLEQLSRTLKDADPDHNVFLSVEGKRLALIGGEGIEVKQPINK